MVSNASGFFITNWQFLFWLLAMWVCGYETRKNWKREAGPARGKRAK